MAQGVPGRLRPRFFLMFGTKRVVGRQPYASAAFILGEIPGTHFQRLSRPQGTWFRRKPLKKSPVTAPGIDPGTSRLVAQCEENFQLCLLWNFLNLFYLAQFPFNFPWNFHITVL